MNRLGSAGKNRSGNRLGYLAGYRPGFADRTGSLTESPRVRAIASRPGPSLPTPTEPYPGAKTPNKEKKGNTTNFAFFRTSRGRARGER